jgi:prevent-host-death family protein
VPDCSGRVGGCSHDHGYGAALDAHDQASEFKAKCLKLMDEVAETGEPLVVTNHGKPIAQLGPAVRKRKSLCGLHKGQIEILSDIIEPVDLDWEVDR